MAKTRHVDFKSSDCSLCSGTHYGSVQCPYQCTRCTVNTDPCFQDGCPRNARWTQEIADADARIEARSQSAGHDR